MRTISLRNAVALAVLPWIIAAVLFQLGLFDRYVKYRYQALAFADETRNRWFGVEIDQYPTDMVVYQELIHRIKPDVIVETGTNLGGLTLYLSSILETIQPKCRIISVDIDGNNWRHTLKTLELAEKDKVLERITFVEASSTSPEFLKVVANQVKPDSKVLIILDSLHTKEHVLAELKALAGFVSKDSYIIVNDTYMEGMYLSYAHAPLSAAREFLAADDRFVVDPSVERFVVTCAHAGFLKRVK